MDQSISQLINSRKENLYYYSQYNFIREIKEEKLVQIEIDKIHKWAACSNEHKIITIRVDKYEVHFFIRFLAWDTDFFLLQTYKLHYVLFDCPFEILKQACLEFNKELVAIKAEYIFIEIPSEDNILMQALTRAGFKLTETRLTYFNNSLDNYHYNRFEVRQAKQEDIPDLRKIASLMRNDYDRFHADPIFPKEIADDFLAKYVD
ncbi:MAG TPA: hypothetical protein VNW99_03865, partial [Cytophagaceae bacterium]|nr:hypothetical protein [Cytophagaceae bacterium]